MTRPSASWANGTPLAIQVCVIESADTTPPGVKGILRTLRPPPAPLKLGTLTPPICCRTWLPTSNAAPPAATTTERRATLAIVEGRVVARLRPDVDTRPPGRALAARVVLAKRPINGTRLICCRATVARRFPMRVRRTARAIRPRTPLMAAARIGMPFLAAVRAARLVTRLRDCRLVSLLLSRLRRLFRRRLLRLRLLAI